MIACVRRVHSRLPTRKQQLRSAAWPRQRKPLQPVVQQAAPDQRRLMLPALGKRALCRTGAGGLPCRWTAHTLLHYYSYTVLVHGGGTTLPRQQRAGSKPWCGSADGQPIRWTLKNATPRRQWPGRPPTCRLADTCQWSSQQPSPGRSLQTRPNAKVLVAGRAAACRGAARGSAGSGAAPTPRCFRQLQSPSPCSALLLHPARLHHLPHPPVVLTPAQGRGEGRQGAAQQAAGTLAAARRLPAAQPSTAAATSCEPGRRCASDARGGGAQGRTCSRCTALRPPSWRASWGWGRTAATAAAAGAGDGARYGRFPPGLEPRAPVQQQAACHAAGSRPLAVGTSQLAIARVRIRLQAPFEHARPLLHSPT